MAIEALGEGLANLVISLLLSPFLILYGLFKMLFGGKQQPVQAPPPPPVQTVIRRRQVTITEEEIVINQGSPGQAAPARTVNGPVHSGTLSPELIEKLELERARYARQIREAQRSGHQV